MWFTEDAWSPIILCVIAAVIFFIAWSTTQRPRLLIGVPLMLLVAVAIYFVEQSVVTDREQVENDLHSLLRTFVEESQQVTSSTAPEDIRSLDFFAAQNATDRARVTAGLLLVVIEDDVRITDVQTRLTNENTRAVTHFRANGNVGMSNVGGRHFSSRWELTWQKEADRWAVTRTKMLNVMTGEEQQIPRID
ncbi:MAG: hypothetical protein ACYTGL_14250 [Planctomycetota bacterium]|jgi:hypothetical protein